MMTTSSLPVVETRDEGIAYGASGEARSRRQCCALLTEHVVAKPFGERRCHLHRLEIDGIGQLRGVESKLGAREDRGPCQEITGRVVECCQPAPGGLDR